MKKTNKKGFTIVELVIVIAVIAILAGVLIPTFSSVVEKANKNAVLQEARNAYTEALANALADGKIEANESTTINNITVTFATANSQTPTFTGTGLKGYTVTYTDGTITVA